MSGQVVPGAGLLDGFARSAEAFGDHTALVIGDTGYTYRELDDLARSWAAAIADATPRRPLRVGVLGYRSVVSYGGVLAALYAGASFVPLNPTFPAERTAAMVRQAGLTAVIVDEASLPVLAELQAELGDEVGVAIAPQLAGAPETWTGSVLVTAEEIAALTPVTRTPSVAGDDEAYLLFTSGTTGVPKGVPISHANVCHFLEVNQQRYGFDAADRFSQTFDQTFDLSNFDLFMAWGVGAAVCVPQPLDLLAPYAFLRTHGVTVWFSVPSVVTVLRKQGSLRPGVMPTLRWSLFCGEALPAEAATAWQHAAPYSVVENLYGPTELTIACAVHRWDPLLSPRACHNGVVPIGELYPGLEAVFLDADGKVAAEGELCVAGPQTFAGYLGGRQPERLLELAPDGGTPRTFYRTGDRVRHVPGVGMIYLGRDDDQVKVGGYRIELREVEAAVQRQPGVLSAVVAVRADRSAAGLESLVAFVVGSDVVPEVVAEGVTRRLPHYMVPKEIHVVDGFPLNVNGKVDRAALVASLAEAEVAG